MTPQTIGEVIAELDEIILHYPVATAPGTDPLLTAAPWASSAFSAATSSLFSKN